MVPRNMHSRPVHAMRLRYLYMYDHLTRSIETLTTLAFGIKQGIHATCCHRLCAVVCYKDRVREAR